MLDSLCSLEPKQLLELKHQNLDEISVMSLLVFVTENVATGHTSGALAGEVRVLALVS